MKRFTGGESNMGTEQEVTSQQLRGKSTRGEVTGERDWGVARGRGSWDPRGMPGTWEQGGTLATLGADPGLQERPRMALFFHS